VTVTFSLVGWSSSIRGDAGPSSDISGVSREEEVVVAVDVGEPDCGCCCCRWWWCCEALGAGLRWRVAIAGWI
jgi:hypothetical protein